MNEHMDDNPADWPCHKLCNEEPIVEYAVFMYNASMWLHQAARGEVPSGGATITQAMTPMHVPEAKQ